MPGGRNRPAKAAAKQQHGGYRAPSSPAAVSGPGALSRRTDGGAGARQPIRPIPAAQQGDRQASVQMQQAAPLAAPADAGAPPAPGAAPAGRPAADPFAPTRRPNEPLTAGAALGPGRTADAPSMALRDRLSVWLQETGDPMWAEMLEDLDAETGIG